MLKTLCCSVGVYLFGTSAIALASSFQTLDEMEVVGQKDNLVGTTASANQAW